MNFLKFCLVAFATFTFFESFAQNPCDIELNGVVIDRHTDEPLSFATIVALNTEKAVASDEAGAFSITGLCAGTITLRVTHVGCAPEDYQLILKGDTTIKMLLSHSESDLAEFEIVEDKNDEIALTRLEMREAAISAQSGKQIAELAAGIPGMRMLQTGNAIAKPVFRGLHSNRLLLMNNGIRQEGQYWGSEHAPEIDSYIAQSVAVIEGVDALRYAPDAIGGVLLVEPPNVFASDKMSGSVQTALSSNGRGGSLAGSLSGRIHENFPLYYRFQGSLKKLGNVRTSDTYLTNTGTEEYNFSYALGYRGKRWEAEVFYSRFNQELGIYRYSHLGNLTDLALAIAGRPAPDTIGFSYEINRPRQVVLHELTKFRFAYDLDTQHKLELIYARQYNSREEYDVHVGRNPSDAALARPQLDYGLTTHLGEAIWHHRQGAFSGKVGGSALTRRNSYLGRRFMPNYENQQIGVFWTETATFEKWTFQYGARYDWYSASIFGPVADAENPLKVDFQGLATAFAARRTEGSSQITWSAGTQWRNPAVNELFSSGLHHGAGGIEEGNPNLGSERSYNTSLGWLYTGTRQRLHVIAYANFIKDFIYLDPTRLELTIRGAFPRYDYAQDDALYTGADAVYDFDLGKSFGGMLRASLVWAENLSENSYFIGVPAHRFEGFFKHTLGDGERFKAPFIGVRGSYTMRQYREPGLYPFENSTVAGANTPLPNSFDFAPAPEAYFLLGAEAGVQFGKSTLSITVENALNKAYRDYMNRFRYFADEMGTNVTVRYKWAF